MLGVIEPCSSLHEMLWWGEVDLRPQGSAVITSNGKARRYIGLDVGSCRALCMDDVERISCSKE